MRVLGLLLMLVGMSIAVFGISGAVSELGRAYRHVLEDPLADAQVDDKTELPRRMLIHVAIGASGVVPLVPGVVLHRLAGSRNRRRSSGSDA